MNEYIVTRVGIALLLGGFFGLVGASYTDPFAGWTLILLVTTIIGFSHYLVGAVYQIRSFRRVKQPTVAYWWFFGLTLLSALLSGVFVATGQVALFALISIGYFMIHGFFNEITLYERTTNCKANRSVIATVALGLMGLMLLTTIHPSAFFSPQLEYIVRNDVLIQLYLASSAFAYIGVWLGVFVLVLAALLPLVAVARGVMSLRNALTLCVLVILGTLTVYYFTVGYIYMFALLLLYHYIVWFCFFLVRFYRTSQSAGNQYLLLHALAFLPFTLLATTGATFTLIDVFVLNSYVFLVLTTIHITTSYMSEEWFKRRFLA